MKKFIFIIFILCQIPLLNANTVSNFIESDIIEVIDTEYQRITIYVDKANISNNLFLLIRKNLIYSGIFDIHKTVVDNTDISLFFKKENWYWFASLQTIGATNIFQDRILKRKTLYQQEDEVILFIKKLAFQLTGEKGILDTAIIYTEREINHPNRIVVTDINYRKKKIILKNKKFNILPKWNKNGHSFLFTENGEAGHHIKIYDFKKKTAQSVAFSKENALFGGTWSVDGNSIFTTFSQRGNHDIYKINLLKNILVRITKNSSIETSPSLAADNNSLLFISDKTGQPQIYQMFLSNKSYFRLTNFGSYNIDPEWSNNGNEIVFSGRKNGQLHLFLMKKFGADIKQLSRGTYSYEDPSWSPDDRQLIFTSDINGTQKIYIMTRDGKYLRRLTNSESNIQESYPDWVGTFNWDYLK